MQSEAVPDLFDQVAEEESRSRDIFDELDSEVAPPQRPITGATGTWEDESGLPPEITNPTQRRQLEMASAQLEGERLSTAEQKIPDLQFLTEVPSAEHISQFLREQREFDKAIHGRGTIIRPTMTPLEQGVDQAKEEFVMGQATPLGVGTMAATLGLGGATPVLQTAGRVAGGIFGYEGIKGTVEGAERFSEAETPQEQIAALASIPVSAATALGGLAGALHRPTPVRPPELPRQTVAALEKGAEAGLNKSVAAAADVVVKEPSKPAVEPAVPVAEPAAAPATPTAAPAQEVIRSIVEMPDAEAGTLKQKPAVEAGMELTAADVPALEAARDAAGKAATDAIEAGNDVAFKAAYGRNIWFSGAIEGANRKGPNYDFLANEKARTQTQPVPEGQAPVVEQGVGAVPENVPASAFFERESEVAGLGRSSLPPGVEDVRAQRARDAATPDTIETTPLDPQSGAPITEPVGVGSKSVGGNPPAPPTAGAPTAPEIPAGQKMRKSAARATTSPDIPAPVQETIKTAPESFYDPQSMKRVEEVVTAMPEEALSGVPPTSDLYVASKLEQARRRFDAGDNDAGYNVFVELEKQGTSFGQNINQFKRLAGALPEHVAFVIDKKLKAAGKDPLTESQRGRVIEITKRNKQADTALDKATEAWKENPTPENAKAAETKLDAANESALELQQFTNKFQPRTTWGTLKSILQGNLLTPISEAYNLFGNMSFAPFRALTRGGAASVDIIDSFIRSKPREVAAQPIRGTIEAAKGAARGIKEIPGILARGTGNAIKGETRSGLHPLRAWADQFAKNPERPTVGGKLGFSERLNLALEGTFGMPAEVMLRGLGAGDAPFRRAAEARVVAEQLKLKNVPRDQWAFAQKFPELFFDRATMEQVRNDAAAAIFQGKSTSLDAINRLIRNNWATQRGIHPDAMDFAFSIVAPYKLTPWKITGEILSYNPLVAVARTALEVKNGNTRAAKLNASKFVVGSVLTGASYWLYQKGLLAPSLDDRDETQKSRILAGEVLPPNHVNISGLKRALEGGDPTFKAGDETVDIFRAGGLAGANMYLVANIGRDFERKPDEAQSGLMGSIIRQSTLESAKFAMNQSYLSGVEGLLTAIKDGSSENYVRQLVNTVGSIPLPNTLGAISRATREYKPDFSAATFDKQVENMVRSRLGFAGLDDYLPLKRGLWGEPLLETPKDKNALFYHFFDISKNKQVTDDPVPLELYRLWRKTGSGKVIPEPVDKAITIQRQTYPLTPTQQSRYAGLVGTERRAITEMLVTNPEFQDYEDEGKMRLLERAYQKGLERGKLAFWDEVGESLQPKPVRAGFK